MSLAILHCRAQYGTAAPLVTIEVFLSGGLPAFIPAQVRGAAAVGIDALFIETHPDPDHALSDGSNMVPLDRMRGLLEMTLAVHSTHRAHAS